MNRVFVDACVRAMLGHGGDGISFMAEGSTQAEALRGFIAVARLAEERLFQRGSRDPSVFVQGAVRNMVGLTGCAIRRMTTEKAAAKVDGYIALAYQAEALLAEEPKAPEP